MAWWCLHFNGQMQSIGKPPILVEPIKATFTMKRKGTVYICDQNGKRTDQTIPVKNGTFTIDGSVSKSPYWEIVYWCLGEVPCNPQLAIAQLFFLRRLRKNWLKYGYRWNSGGIYVH